MNPFELVALSLSALKETKVRSGLTIFMVVIGVTLMTSLTGLAAGLDNFINEQFETLGANILIVTPYEVTAEFGPPAEGVKIRLTSQTASTIERIYGVKYAIPIYTGAARITCSGEDKTVQILGIDQSKLNYIAPKTSLEAGSYVSLQDSAGILLGYNVAYPPDLDRTFARWGQIVCLEFPKVTVEGGREKIALEKKSFQVKGILNELGNVNYDRAVFVSPAAADSLLDKGGAYDAIYAVTRDPELNDEVEARIRKIYGRNIGITSPKAIASTIQDIIGTFESFVSAIALVSMLVGAVGIITTLYTSVMERTREIGLLKAIGYSDRTVLLMFLIESIGIGIIGGMVGLIVGIGGSFALIGWLPFGDGLLSFTPHFPILDLATTFLFAFGLSIVAGLYPAWRAAKLSPIDALRKQ